MQVTRSRKARPLSARAQTIALEIEDDEIAEAYREMMEDDRDLDDMASVMREEAARELASIAVLDAETAQFVADCRDYEAREMAHEDARLARIEAAFQSARREAFAQGQAAPEYTQVPGLNLGEWKAANGYLFSLMNRAGMDVTPAVRIAGAAKYLGLGWLSSFKQFSLGEIERLARGIQRGELRADWAPVRAPLPLRAPGGVVISVPPRPLSAQNGRPVVEGGIGFDVG